MIFEMENLCQCNQHWQNFAFLINRSPQRRQSWKEVCRIMNLPGKYIEYDVETRWNSTFRMLDDALKAKAQIIRFMSFHTELQPFTDRVMIGVASPKFTEY